MTPLVLLFVAAATLSFRPQRNGEVADLVARVSDPHHSDYLKFLTPQNLHDRYAPTAAQVASVVGWLNGTEYRMVNGRRWQMQVASNSTRAASHPLVHPPSPSRRHRSWGGTPTYEVFVGQTFQSAYGVPHPPPPFTTPVRVAIVSDDTRDTFQQSDLNLFQRVMGVNPPLNVTTVNNTAFNSNFVESTLDMDSVAGVAVNGTQLEFIMNSNSNIGDFCYYLLSQPVSRWPHLVSISWGQNVEDPFTDQCFQLLAAGGVSIAVSSGDTGAAGWNMNCNPADGFQPNYPATSLYATAVGATYFTGTGQFIDSPLCYDNWTVAQMSSAYGIGTGVFSATSDPILCWGSGVPGSEAAVYPSANGFSSGGGFSQQFEQPSWQAAAVSQYLSSPIPFPSRTYGSGQSLWNPAYRGFPDVAMFGAGSILVFNGQFGAEAGTSQSSPLFAGLMTYVVAWYLHRFGVGPGLLNPLLYALAARNPATFHDVVVGNNNGTEAQQPSQCPLGGFTATSGWDPVSGLGSPNIGAMIAELELMFPPNSSSSSSTGGGSFVAPSSTVLPSSSSPIRMSSSSGTPPPPSSSSAPFPTWAIYVAAFGGSGSVVSLGLLAFWWHGSSGYHRL